jgi:hypothetical protein
VVAAGLILGLAAAAVADAPAAAAIPAPRVEMGHPTARPAATGGGGAASPGGWAGAAFVGLALIGAGAAAWALRGRAIAATPDGVAARVVGRVALGPRHAAYLVRVADRVLVVGTGGGGAPALLAELDAEVVRAPAPSPGVASIASPAGPAGGER